MHTLAARQFQFNLKNRNPSYCATTIEKFVENLCGIQYPEPIFDLEKPYSVTTDRLVIVKAYYLKWGKTCSPLHVHSLRTHSRINHLKLTLFVKLSHGLRGTKEFKQKPKQRV